MWSFCCELLYHEPFSKVVGVCEIHTHGQPRSTRVGHHYTVHTHRGPHNIKPSQNNKNNNNDNKTTKNLEVGPTAALWQRYLVPSIFRCRVTPWLWAPLPLSPWLTILQGPVHHHPPPRYLSLLSSAYHRGWMSSVRVRFIHAPFLRVGLAWRFVVGRPLWDGRGSSKHESLIRLRADSFRW